MKFLQKILFAVMITLFVGNADSMIPAAVATIFDLPANTPGLQASTQVKTVCGTEKGCVHVIVPGTEAHTTYIDSKLKPLNSKERAGYACSKNGNIYFPADGAQPTTPEAVEYSCANIDNRENSPITEWYMQMFGVPANNLAANAAIPVANVLAGWGDNALAHAIITFDASVNNITMIDDPESGLQVSRVNLFIKNFRKIASSSVGRVLLYRILIEIRRHEGTNSGVCENNQHLEVFHGLDFITFMENFHDFFQTRNACRKLKISWEQSFAFIRTANLHFNNNVVNKQVATHLIGMNNVCIGTRISSIDEDLFHEFLHWYHWLREPYRFSRDTNEVTSKRPPLKINDISRIGGVYYNNLIGISESQLKLLTVAWCTRSSSTNYLIANFEEMRTILGLSKVVASYIEGDDLSENLFILLKKLKMNKQQFPEIRFGHKDFVYVEHIFPVKIAISTACKALKDYVQNVSFLPFVNVTHIPDYLNINGWNGTKYQQIVDKVALQVRP